VNRSTQESMPMTAMPEGKIVCIGGDGGGMKSQVPYFPPDFIHYVFSRLLRQTFLEYHVPSFLTLARGIQLTNLVSIGGN
jgi:hypothetical protein